MSAATRSAERRARRAYIAGARARHAAVPQEDCPFTQVLYAKWWSMGWTAADQKTTLVPLHLLRSLNLNETPVEMPVGPVGVILAKS